MKMVSSHLLFMKSAMVIIVLSGLLSSFFSCATTLSKPTMPDTTALPTNTTALPPNTVQVTGQVIEEGEDYFVLNIVTVKEQGQGIINMLSEGQSVKLKTEKAKNTKGKKIEALLKESIGTDASLSSYALVKYKEI
jgi:hypothetical protein